MANERILILVSDSKIAHQLNRAILAPAGYDVTTLADMPAAEALFRVNPPEVVILDETFKDGKAFEFVAQILERMPNLAAILLVPRYSEEVTLKVIRLGFADCLVPPLRPDDVKRSVLRAVKRGQLLQEWTRMETRRNTKSLQKRLEGMETLQRIGRSVTALLDIDNVLTAVVDAAVELTGAEEGSLLLLDEFTGELYMRASRNFQDEFVRTFRLPIRDSLAGQVLRTGEPITLDEKTPQKIKTAYLVHTLIYVPLQVHGRVIGVLGVDNRHGGHPFLEDHKALVSSLADFAAIAIENARLYSNTEIERKKLETILTHVEDGVIVVDFEGRLVMANQTVQSAFGLHGNHLAGKPAREIFQHPDLVEVLSDEKRSHASRYEITLDDGRVFNTQLTPIPEVGLAVTMQDITHLKELDRIKSDFVSTVSHDLRSPLTAILGYVELIGRAGPVTDQQREFIHRVQMSVNNITSLINDLLDLGRIEAGFDARKEIVPLAAIIQYAVEGLRTRINEKGQILTLSIEEKLPPVLGNPVRLRQLINNVLGNSVKYTSRGGQIGICMRAEAGQVILQVSDNGPGIPPADQPYIFDKFYRASNVPNDMPGTGLGLAIVKSIVENHQGRIWVDSTLGQGSIFTVVFPIADEEI